MTARLLACLVLAAILGLDAAEAQVPGWNSKQFRIEQIDDEPLALHRPGRAGERGRSPARSSTPTSSTCSPTTIASRRRATSSTRRRRRAYPPSASTFITRTGTGTFYNASGIASLGAKRRPEHVRHARSPTSTSTARSSRRSAKTATRSPRAASPPACSRRRAGRWSPASARINVDDYAMLSNAVMRVKDVPIFYLPFMYYPIQDDDRATGFLLPDLRRGRLRGQSISNAFFWAINRSQDAHRHARLVHQTGQGVRRRVPLRCVADQPGQHARLLADAEGGDVNGGAGARVAQRAETGAVTQDLPLRLKGRARIDYFVQPRPSTSSTARYLQRHAEPSTWNGNVSGSWRFVNASATATRTQQFFNTDQSRITGSLPSLTGSRVEPQAGTGAGVLLAAVRGRAADLHRPQRRHRPRPQPAARRPAAQPAHAGQPVAVPEHEPHRQLPHHLVQREHDVRPGRERLVQVDEPFTRRYAELRGRDASAGVQQGLHAEQRLRRLVSSTSSSRAWPSSAPPTSRTS